MAIIEGKQIQITSASQLYDVVLYDSSSGELYHTSSAIFNNGNSGSISSSYDTYGGLTRHWLFTNSTTQPTANYWAWINTGSYISINETDNDGVNLKSLFAYIVGNFSSSYLLQVTSVINPNYYAVYRIGRNSESIATGRFEIGLEGIISKDIQNIQEGELTAISFIPTNETSSYSISSSFAISSSVATSASFTISSSRAISSSFALTSSYLNPLNQSIVFVNGRLVVSNSINSPARTLIDSSGEVSIGWGDRVLYYTIGTPSIDWENGISYDINEIGSVSWLNRLLYDNNGIRVIDWNSLILNDGNGDVSLNWSNKILIDNNGIASLDWKNKILYDDSNTESVNWNSRTLHDLNNIESVNWNGRILLDENITHSINWNNRTLYDNNNTESINWKFRYINYGSENRALDWGSEGIIKLIGTSLISGSIRISESIYLEGIQSSSQPNVIVVGNDGRLYYMSTSSFGGGSSGSTSPGGNNQQIQYNNNGNFDGVPTLIYNGSLLIATGSFTGSFIGSLQGTSSYALNSGFSDSSSFATTASFAISASFVTSASFASTASFVNGHLIHPYDGNIITGSTAITGSYTMLIPGNTFNVGDLIQVQCVYRKPIAASNTSFYFYINNSNSLSGATQVAIFNTTTARYVGMSRDLCIESSTETKVFSAATTAITDMNTIVTTTATTSSLNIDWTTDKFFIFAASNATLADQTIGRRFSIIKI